MENNNRQNICRVCGSSHMTFHKANNIKQAVDSSLFAITDNAYGVTGELWKCEECGFIQAVDLDNLKSLYENLEDPVYLSQEDCRRLQAKKFLKIATVDKKPGRLLDIGAGCGFLVHEAINAGWDAVGVEPCLYLQEKAKASNLPVIAGSFPNAAIEGKFDVVTIADVIEHVSDPVGLLRDIAQVLSPGGVIFLTTPDSGAIPAKLLGNKWWHYRVAHVGYFNKLNLVKALARAGLKPLKSGRPSWYFGLDYILERPLGYLPFKIPPTFLKKLFAGVTIPLNLRDSLFVLASR